MDWKIMLARFVAGLFFGNGLPHLVNGVSGRRFPTPFAKPPTVGKSSPVVNVLWASFNIAVAGWLFFAVGDFTSGLLAQVALAGLGALVAALTLSWWFGKTTGES